MILNAPTRTALRCIKAIRDDLVYNEAPYLTNEQKATNYACKIWALDKVEDLIFHIDKPPLDIIEEFAWKMRAYSGLNDIFTDCWLEMEILIDFLTEC